MAFLGLVLWVGVFVSVASIGEPSVVDQIDFESLSPFSLFQMHAVLVATLALFLALGYWRCGHDAVTVVLSQLGMRLRPGQTAASELGLGLGTGILLWAGVLAVMAIAGLVAGAASGFEDLPTEAPKMVLWMGGLPVLFRFMVSVSAGVVEEVFFRGFLMPRAGLVVSNVLFVLAHLSYEQPTMLLGVGLLSVAFSWLTLWRGNIWAAVIAHFLFDAIQLLVIVPLAANAAGW